jgi:poly(A) polymerase
MEPELSDRHANVGRAAPGLREAAVAAARKLIDAGHVAYFAGGCVRDRLMGHEPEDYDIATDARPEQVAAIFPNVQTVGEAFGVMLVRMQRHVIQVATFRTEGVYSDGRRPDSVAFTDAQHDASRRDFTINGLFEHPLTGEVIDYVGGQVDLQARIIRAIGDPLARFREDNLRMLRAVRFMARFGFSLDPDTADAIRSQANELRGVSRERIGQEIKRMLTDSNRAVAAWELQYLGLDSPVLLEPNLQVAPTRLGRLPDEAAYPAALAAWLLDRRADDRATDRQSLERAGRWADALTLSNEERFGLVRCIEIYHTLFADWPRLGVARQKRMAVMQWFNEAVLLVQATDRQVFVDVRRRVIELDHAGGLAPPPLIDGTDLIAAGMQPGPVFSRVLDAVYDAQLEGSIVDKPQALALAKAVAAAELGA